MNTIPCCRFSCVVSLATVTVLGSEFEAQSETSAFSGSTEVPTSGITANQAAALADQPAEYASDTSTSEAAQATETSSSTLEPIAPVPPSQTPAISFSDVDVDYWAYPFIQTLVSGNAIASFSDNTFNRAVREQS